MAPTAPSLSGRNRHSSNGTVAGSFGGVAAPAAGLAAGLVAPRFQYLVFSAHQIGSPPARSPRGTPKTRVP